MFFPTGIFSEEQYIWMLVIKGSSMCKGAFSYLGSSTPKATFFPSASRGVPENGKLYLSSGLVLKDWSHVDYLSRHTEIWVACWVAEGSKDPSAFLIPRPSFVVLQNTWERRSLVFLRDCAKVERKESLDIFYLNKVACSWSGDWEGFQVKSR